MSIDVDSDLLQSPVYNPQYEDTTVALFKIMQQENNDEELLKEYMDMFAEMPTKNPYKGVLVNPRACEVDEAVTEIDKIRDQIKDRYDDIIGNGNPGNNPTPGEIVDLNDWERFYPGIDKGLQQSSDILKDFKDHTDRIIGNFPTIIATIQGSIGNNSASNGIGMGNGFGGGQGGGMPCIPFADILGSILQAGQALMAKIMGAIAAVAGAVGQVMAIIQNAVAMLQQMVMQALAMLQAEVMKIVQAMLGMIQMGLAQLMAFLPNDPCLKAIMGGLLSGAASKVMGKIGM